MSDRTPEQRAADRREIEKLHPGERFQMMMDEPVDLDAMLAACIPGGDTCDPQEVADAIREWFADHVVGANKKAPDADGWIPHRPGDPMPCDGETLVNYQCRAEDKRHALLYNEKAWRLKWGPAGGIRGPKYEPAEIIAWKPAE